ncbi:MAG: pyridoxamine 5'-phosphate oxidase family protein [Rickettsiales bacterium]|nr:pyridoxamine 5'-phosphate oxidase family protein [Rickettsiales bacterium]
MTKKEALRFFDNQPIVILSTIGPDGTPQTRALVNVRNKNISPNLIEYFKKTDRIFLMTNTHTDKIREMHVNPAASIYMYDNEFNGMLLTGAVAEITDDKIKDAIWDDSLTHYYPSGRRGGDFSVIEFVPKTFKTYNGADFHKEQGDVM